MRSKIYGTIFFVLIFGIFFFPALTASGAVETYLEAITQAQTNAASPSGWIPQDNSPIRIPGDHSTDSQYGLKYASDGNLIVRNMTAYKTDGSTAWLDSLYVNTPGYKFRPTGDPKWTAAWVTTGNDMTKFYDANKSASVTTGADSVKLLERGLGMNNDASHNTVIEYTVVASNEYIMRPTKNPDIRAYSTDPAIYGDPGAFVQPDDMTAAWANFYGTDGTDGYYANWKSSVYPAVPPPTLSNFPWTQLGYSYFWGNGDTPPTGLSQVQGMTEFIILAKTSVNVYGIYATQSYVYTKNKNGSFSSDADAEYGNGFASFDIAGECDSIWAGHRFQVNTRTSPSLKNEITIEPGAVISGGEGILVWSLNYNVTNNGTINGSTASKIAVAGTSDIGILFQGDTTAYGGIAAPTGINELTNNGTISSPGTAVKIASGDTTITNNAGAVISGTTRAINMAGGDLTLKNRGTITGGVALGAGVTASLDIGTTTVDVDGGYISALSIGANSAADHGKAVVTGGTYNAREKLDHFSGQSLMKNAV